MTALDLQFFQWQVFFDPRLKHRHLENKEEINSRIIDECMRSMACNAGTTESSPGAAGTSPPPKKNFF